MGWLEAPSERKIVFPVCMAAKTVQELYTLESMTPETNVQRSSERSAWWVDIRVNR